MDQVQICLENFSKSFIANNVKSINKIYEEGIYKCVNKYPLQFWPSVHVVSNDINGDAFFILFYKELTVRKQFYEAIAQIKNVEELQKNAESVESLLIETFEINNKMMNYMFENPEKYFLSLPITYFLDFIFSFVDRFYFYNKYSAIFTKRKFYSYDFCLKQMNSLVTTSRIINRKNGVYFRTNEHTFLMGFISLTALCNFHFVTANFGLVGKYLLLLKDIQFVALSISLSIPKMCNSVKIYKLFTICFYMSIFVGIYCQDMAGLEFAVNNYVSLTRGSSTFLKFADCFESLIFKNVLFKSLSLGSMLKRVYKDNFLKLVDWASFDKVLDLFEYTVQSDKFDVNKLLIRFLSINGTEEEHKKMNAFVLKQVNLSIDSIKNNLALVNAVFEITDNVEVPEEYFKLYDIENFKNHPQIMSFLTFENKNSQKNFDNPNCTFFKGVSVDEINGVHLFNGAVDE